MSSNEPPEATSQSCLAWWFKKKKGSVETDKPLREEKLSSWSQMLKRAEMPRRNLFLKREMAGQLGSASSRLQSLSPRPSWVVPTELGHFLRKFFFLVWIYGILLCVSAVPVPAVGMRVSLPLVTVGTPTDCHLCKPLLVWSAHYFCFFKWTHS